MHLPEWVKLGSRPWQLSARSVARKPQYRKHRCEDHCEEHHHNSCFAEIVDVPDMAGRIGRFAALPSYPWRQMGKSGTEVKHDCCKPKLAHVSNRTCGSVTTS